MQYGERTRLVTGSVFPTDVRIDKYLIVLSQEHRPVKEVSIMYVGSQASLKEIFF